MCSVLVLICNLLYWLLLSVVTIKGRIIETNSGPVRGRLVRYEQISYYSYEGIPYAENPTGTLRFQPPVPRRLWTNVFNATQEPLICPQVSIKYKQKEMSEDCLRLNIFVPENNFDNLLPVLVWIHGGGFHLISGNTDLIYGPQLLLQRGLIFITVNYRLGVLGFLSLGIEEASGNAGLKDILLALKWIKINIEKFGGNSNNVSIGGNSSGASIVNYLLMTNHSSGLFHRAILLSGSALSYRVLSKHPIENAMALAKLLCPHDNDKEMILKCLRHADVFDLVKARVQMKKEDDNILRPFNPFIPSVEKEFSHAIITKEPIEILKSQRLLNVPILAGFNSDEGIYMTSHSLRRPDLVVDVLRKNIEMTIPTNIEYPLKSEKSVSLAKSIVTFYFGDEHLSNWTLNNAYDFISDTHYVYGIDTWINMHKRKKGSSSVYYYIFNFDGDLNWCKIFYNISFPGTSHADDLGYLFVTKATKLKLKSADNRNWRTVNVMTTMLSNFVKYGNPSPTPFSKVVWPEYGAERNMLLLSDNPSVLKIYESIKIRLKFWSDIYNEYYQYIANGGILESKILP